MPPGEGKTSTLRSHTLYFLYSTTTTTTTTTTTATTTAITTTTNNKNTTTTAIILILLLLLLLLLFTSLQTAMVNISCSYQIALVQLYFYKIESNSLCPVF